MAKVLVAVACLGLTANAAAETMSLDSMSIELPSGWVHRVDKASPPDSRFGNQITVRRTEGVGTMYLQTYTATESVNWDTLSDLTNVPITAPLVKQNWGGFSGYRHDYVEKGLFHRTWWLAQDTNVLFVTYQCDAGQQHLEIDQVENIVRSLSSTTARDGN
jgi:hypothetical protein